MDAERYSGILAEAVDEGLSALGSSSKVTIYDGLDEVFNLRKADIPRRFCEFSEILRRMMGRNAEPILEFIMDRFYNELGVEPKRDANLDEKITRICTMLKICRPAQRKNTSNHKRPPFNSAVAKIYRAERSFYYAAI